jgi:hypothetical protein
VRPAVVCYDSSRACGSVLAASELAPRQPRTAVGSLCRGRWQEAGQLAHLWHAVAGRSLRSPDDVAPARGIDDMAGYLHLSLILFIL